MRGAHRCTRAHHLSNFIGCRTHLTHAVNSGLSGPMRLLANMPSTYVCNIAKYSKAPYIMAQKNRDMKSIRQWTNGQPSGRPSSPAVALNGGKQPTGCAPACQASSMLRCALARPDLRQALSAESAVLKPHPATLWGHPAVSPGRRGGRVGR